MNRDFFLFVLVNTFFISFFFQEFRLKNIEEIQILNLNYEPILIGIKYLYTSSLYYNIPIHR